MRADLIHDLQGLLLAAFELGDYNSVKKFAGYLEDLTNEEQAPRKASPGRPRKNAAPKPAKPVKPAKVTKAAKAAKIEKVAKAARAVLDALPEMAEKAPKKAKKAVKEKAVKGKKEKAPKKEKAQGKAKAQKPAKKETPKRGAAKYEPGTKLGANFKGSPLELTIVEGGLEHGGQVYPSLRTLVDAVAGEKQAMHLRYMGNWKPLA